MAAIIQSMVVGEVMTNCYFLQNPETKELIIIDPGACADRIREKVSAMEGKPAAILLTHGHFDHIMAVDSLRAYYGCPVYAEKHEREVLENPRKNLTAMTGSAATVTPDRYLTDGAEITLAGFRIRVMHTPGHTCGGCCYYLPDEKVLFSGDTLFAGSCGRTDFPTASMTDMIASLRRILTELPDDTAVYPGHNMATTIRAEKEFNPYAPR